MAYASEIFTSGASLSDRFKALRHAIAERRASNRAYRNTLNELENLTDRELADLGITRSNIKGIAYDAAMNAR